MTYDRRQASTRCELVYQTGGTGGPYDNEAKAKEAAERLMKGGQDRWIAIIDAKDTRNLTRAKMLWILKRGEDWEKGTGPLPNVRPVEHYRDNDRNTRFQPGDKVKINKRHGIREWHGDEGTVEKFVPFAKYYVNMDSGDRRLVSEEDLDPT